MMTHVFTVRVFVVLVCIVLAIGVGVSGIMIDIAIVHMIPMQTENMRYGDILPAFPCRTPSILPITRNNKYIYKKTIISPKAMSHWAIISAITSANHKNSILTMRNCNFHSTKIGKKIITTQNQPDPDRLVSIPNRVMKMLDMMDGFIGIMYVKYRRE